MSDTIIYHKESGLAKITLNRPEKYNSFTQEMAKAFQAALDDVKDDNDIRAVVITGNGKAFCAGQDLAEAVADNGLELEEIVREHYNPIIKRITSLEKPVIAGINGVAAGAGANIALSCDIVVATESASFIQAFSKIGLIPDSGGTYFLQRLIGQQKASAIMMLGDKISAQEAERIGMIYKYFADEEFEEQLNKLAQKISKMPTKGLAFTKKLLQLSWDSSLEMQLESEKEYQVKAANTYDYKEGTAAFLEKRKPAFKGE